MATEPPVPGWELLERLTPYLAEAVELVGPDLVVRARLAPPDGLLGHGPGRVGAPALEFTHPDDLSWGLEMASAILQSAPGWQGRWPIRLRRADASWGQYEVQVTNCSDDPVLAGFVVRTRELANPAEPDLGGLDVDFEHGRSLAEALPAAIVVADLNGRIQFANPAAAVLLGRPASALTRLELADLAQDGTGLLDAVAEAGDGGPPLSVTFASGADPGRLIEATVAGVGVAEDTTLITAALTDITSRVRIEADLRRRATEDALTGALNRDVVEGILSDRLAGGRGATVLYCDLDGFKSVNDTWGHEKGDQVLAGFAGVLRSVVRQGDAVGRWGGDEFVVVTDDLSPTATSDLVTRIRQRTARRLGASGVRPSIGVAHAHPADSLSSLMRRADQAMYQDKAGSRDEVQ